MSQGRRRVSWCDHATSQGGVPERGLAVPSRALSDEALRPGEVPSAGPSFDRDDGVRREPGNEGFEDRHDIDLVRRIEERDVVARFRAGGEEDLDLHRYDVSPGQLCGRDVVADGVECGRVVLDERRALGAAAERLQAEGAGAGIEVEHPRTVDVTEALQAGEQPLAGPV